VLAVQRAPSVTHALVHASVGDGTQRGLLVQHSLAVAQGWPGGAHDCERSHRDTAPSNVHLAGEQHCGSPVHVSPAPPQLPAGAHRFTPLASDTHEPEQQSAFVSHRSHSGAHPPMGAQRLLPSFVDAHDRVQQSPATLHVSPTILPHGFASFAWHAPEPAQRPFAHEPEQQSSGAAQSSPVTRHASSNAQRPPVHTCPQHSALPLQASPAGAQPGAFAHVPPLHVLLQQSIALTHDVPATAHIGELVHEPRVPSGARHASEQHALASVHVCPTPPHPVVGLHVISENGSSAQRPEQH